MNRIVTLSCGVEAQEARQAFLDGRPMAIAGHGLISLSGVAELSPALVLISCPGGRVVPIAWPPQPIVKRRSGCPATMAIVGILVALFALLWALA